ncbi:MAG: hypothetical protein EOO40_05830, partial [Deltaproteobacteria bacterium]
MDQVSPGPQNDAALVENARGIYASLAAVEERCIAVHKAYEVERDAHKAAGRPMQSVNEAQWRDLTRLYADLFGLHYELLLTCSHPLANASLRAQPSACATPARLWHNIFCLAERLRLGLPESVTYLHTLLDDSYNLYQDLNDEMLGDTSLWPEILGDIARYKSAIPADNNLNQFFVAWDQLADTWYRQASALLPEQGRLYHHRGTVAGHTPSTQLMLFSKALAAEKPFLAARHSLVATFLRFEPLPLRGGYVDALQHHFFAVHQVLQTSKPQSNLQHAANEYNEALGRALHEAAPGIQGFLINATVANLCSVLEIGQGGSGLPQVLPPELAAQTTQPAGVTYKVARQRCKLRTRQFVCQNMAQVLQYYNEARDATQHSVLPAMHVACSFLVYLSQSAPMGHDVVRDFPWRTLAVALNQVRSDAIRYEEIAARAPDRATAGLHAFRQESNSAQAGPGGLQWSVEKESYERISTAVLPETFGAFRLPPVL